jgi:sporulation related protein
MVDLPNWSHHDASRPPALPEHAERPGRLVAVLTTDGAREDGWAAEFILGLVSAWSEEGHRVVLADIGLDEPSLHGLLGAPNAEGVADVVLFGSSVRRVAKAAPEGGFFFISAGTAPADPSDVLGHLRWGRLCNGFLDAGVTLVAFAHAECPGTERVASVATDLIVLARRDEDVSALLRDATATVHLFTGPGAADVISPTTPDDEPDPEAHLFDVLETDTDGSGTPHDSVEGFEESPAADDANESAASVDEPSLSPIPDDLDPQARVSDELEDVGAAAGAEAYEDEFAGYEETVDAVSEDSDTVVRSTGSRDLILLVLSVVILSIVVAASMGLVDIPGLSPDNRGAASPLADTSRAARSVPFAESTLRLTHSIAVGAYQDETVAAGRVEALAASEGVFVITAPIRLDGAVFHRVLLGPATDSASARALADQVAAGLGVDPTTWVVRSTPLAFQLGDIPDLETTNRRVEVLRGLGVPAYALALDFVDGTTRYRVYAGAYADEEEAAYLLSHLAAQGLENATITTRIGRVP